MGQIIKTVVAGIVLILVVVFVDARWGVKNIGSSLSSAMDKAVHGTPAVYDSMVTESTEPVNGSAVDALFEQDGRAGNQEQASASPRRNTEASVDSEGQRLARVFEIYEKAAKRGAASGGAEEEPVVTGE